MYLCISSHMVRRVIAISGSPFADWAVFNDKVTKKKQFLHFPSNLLWTKNIISERAQEA